MTLGSLRLGPDFAWSILVFSCLLQYYACCFRKSWSNGVAATRIACFRCSSIEITHVEF
jgi:hypothetical protein